MPLRRALVPVLAALLVLPPALAVAAPGDSPGDTAARSAVASAGREGESGNGPERNLGGDADAAAGARSEALRGTPAQRAPQGTSGQSSKHGDWQAYPRQTRLRTYDVDPSDRSIKPGLIPYHAIAPRLNALQRASDRVSVEVIGQSVLGRDLYFVTLTAPETRAQVRQQEAWRRQIEADPVRAKRNAALMRGYKTPVLVNGNIHGNEWEGTDGIMRVLEEWGRSSSPEVRRILRTHRLYFNVTQNPDGRVAGTRANANGFNLNRDFITWSQPETRALAPMIKDKQAVMLLDEHGYVAGTLIEPCTPPHGPNYEYDLFIKPALANALRMERVVERLYTDEERGGAGVDIPFRDDPYGWDDFPPIFTPQYGLYHGSIGYTIEVPLRINGAIYDGPAAELRRRSAINTDVVEATIETTIDYVDDNRRSLLHTQMEQFRRGIAGEQREDLPIGFVPGWDEDDQGYVTRFPRAYVIPSGSGQRSAPAAARLVDHLVRNDVRVERASRAFWLAGRRYPAGSYVVDMHQPKRGLANVMLEAGQDISDRVPLMYDISGWSHRLLWGASVDVVRNAPAVRVPGRDVVVADPTGYVPPAPRRDLLLRLVDGKDVEAVNALADRGVTGLVLTASGDVLVPAAARRLAVRVAEQYGVRFAVAPAGTTGTPLDEVTVAAAAAGDEVFVLESLGFRVLPISTDALNAGFSWAGVDVAYVGSDLTWADLTAEAQAAMVAWLEVGGVVTRGSTGAAFNADAGLLDVTAVEGNPDGNGVVRVANRRGPVTGSAPSTSFVYSPLWFTGLGTGVQREQSYGADPLVSGHWTANLLEDEETGELYPDPSGAGGPGEAAGQASIVRGVDETGAGVVMFGTEPLFRDHTKGLYAQVARGLYWAATTGAPPIG